MGLRGVLIVVLLCIVFIPSCREQALDAAGQAMTQVAAAAGQAVGQAIDSLVSGMVRSATDRIKGVADDVSDKVRSATDGIMDSAANPFRDFPNVEPGAGDADDRAAPPVFESMDEAALAALAEARRYSQCSDELDEGPFEYGGVIYRRADGDFSFSGPLRGIGDKFSISAAKKDFNSRRAASDVSVAHYHSHAILNAGDWFSVVDLCTAAILGEPSYLVRAGGLLGDRNTRKFLPTGGYLEASLRPPPDPDQIKDNYFEYMDAEFGQFRWALVNVAVGKRYGGSGGGVVTLTEVPEDGSQQCPTDNKVDSTETLSAEAAISNMFSRCIYDEARISCLAKFVNDNAVPASDCNPLQAAGIRWESCVVAAIKRKYGANGEQHIKACGAVPW